MLHATKEENKKIQDLKREYTRQGYRVIVEPPLNDLPVFLRNMNYQPDLIAYGGKKNLIIEVKSRRTIEETKSFSHISDWIRKQPEWDFILVMTNPKTEKVIEEWDKGLSHEYAESQLNKTSRLLEMGQKGEFNEAALLLAWAGLEGSMRYALLKLYGKGGIKRVSSVIRDAVMLGMISRDESEYLESSKKIRDSIMHGIKSEQVHSQEVSRLVQMANNILIEAANSIHINNKNGE